MEQNYSAPFYKDEMNTKNRWCKFATRFVANFVISGTYFFLTPNKMDSSIGL